MERNYSTHSSRSQSVPLYILPTNPTGRNPTLTPGLGAGGSYGVEGMSGETSVYIVPGPIAPTEDVDIHTDGSDLLDLGTGQLDYFPRDLDVDAVWDWDNGSSLMHNDSFHASMDAFNWSILLLAPLVVFGIAGNTLVILAISLERRLQNVTNYFLLSLAVTDLLVSLIVMPLSIINEFTGQWLFGLILCNLFVTADVFMCTSSILHLCTISLERYIGIRYPLWTKNKSKRTVFFKIVLVWTLAIAITSPITVLGIVSEDNIYQDGQCSLSNQHFIIYGSIFAFFIPLLIMVVMYALTVHMLNRQAQLCGAGAGTGEREGQPMIRRSTSSRRHWQRHTNTRHSDLGSSSASRNSFQREPLSTTNSYPLGPGGSRYTQRYQPLGKRNTIPLYKMRKDRDGTNRDHGPHEHCNGKEETLELDSSPGRGKCWRMPALAAPRARAQGALQQQDSNGEPKRLKELVRKHHVAVKAANILLMRKDFVRKENSSVQTEQKASKVLGVVFMIFVVCWAPFFLVNILTVLCPTCYFSPTLFTVFVWLGYVSSTLNPIIYTVFNKVFKLTFLKLLCCRYGLLHRGRRRSGGTGFVGRSLGTSTGGGGGSGGGGSGGSSTHSGVITCNSFCAYGGSHEEESMC